MNINWKVRLRNPVFWMTIIPTVIAIVYYFLSLLGICPKVAENSMVEFGGLIVSFLAGIGVLNDPTTNGLSDSQRAMGYEKPYVVEYEDNDE